jgi:hypothetical protein
VLVDPFTERIEILRAGIVVDIVEGSDTNRVVGRDCHDTDVCVLVASWGLPSQDQVITCRADVPKATDVHQHLVHIFHQRNPASPSLLQDIGEIIVLRPGDLGIAAEVTYLLVGARVTAVAVHRLDNGVEIIKGSVSTLTLCSYPGAKITSRPLSIRILQ